MNSVLENSSDLFQQISSKSLVNLKMDSSAKLLALHSIFLLESWRDMALGKQLKHILINCFRNFATLLNDGKHHDTAKYKLRIVGQWFQIYQITHITIHFIWHYTVPRNTKFYHLLKLIKKLISTIRNWKWKKPI